MADVPKMEIFMRCACGACLMLEWPRDWKAWDAEAEKIAIAWNQAHAKCLEPTFVEAK